jgi:hypothetical protein
MKNGISEIDVASSSGEKGAQSLTDLASIKRAYLIRWTNGPH